MKPNRTPPIAEPPTLAGVMDAAADLDDFLQVLVNGRRTLVEGGWAPETAEQLMLALVLQASSS